MTGIKQSIHKHIKNNNLQSTLQSGANHTVNSTKLHNKQVLITA